METIVLTTTEDEALANELSKALAQKYRSHGQICTMCEDGKTHKVMIEMDRSTGPVASITVATLKGFVDGYLTRRSE